ncbi:MAG: phosphatase PAP2 family protein [Phycisphaerae bacterium]|nr:phosphatase PAP2 family protein [Phycisphaerae bacterium]
MNTKCFFSVLVLAALVLMAGCVPAEQKVTTETSGQLNAERVDFNAKSVEPVKSEAAASTESVGPVKSLWNDIWTLPEVVIEETPEVALKPGNSFLLLAAGAGSVVMHNSGADAQVARNFENRGNLNHDVDKITDYLGGPGLHFAASGLWYLASANAGDEFNKDRSWTMIKALSVTGASTLGLKIIRGNNCPNGKSLAWPSGHTSSSFTVAAVLDEFYGPEVGIPAYIGASFVGYRMMDSGDHWASDVLFGGVLGYLVGHHVAGKDEAARIAGFDLAPLTVLETGEPATGLMLVRRF